MSLEISNTLSRNGDLIFTSILVSAKSPRKRESKEEYALLVEIVCGDLLNFFGGKRSSNISTVKLRWVE